MSSLLGNCNQNLEGDLKGTEGNRWKPGPLMCSPLLRDIPRLPDPKRAPRPAGQEGVLFCKHVSMSF